MIKSERIAKMQLSRQLQRAARQVRDMIGLRAFWQAIAGTPTPPIRIDPDPPGGALVARSIFFEPNAIMFAMRNGEKIGKSHRLIWG